MTNIAVVCTNLIEEDGRYLLVQEVKEPDVGKYNLPGGRLREGEDYYQCLVREGEEETGLIVEPRYLVGIYQRPHSSKGRNVTVLAFNSNVVGGDIRTSQQHPKVDFFPFEQIADLDRTQQLATPVVMQAIQDYRSGQSIPLEAIKILR